jgi:outer membrane biosynthesis protein TonB
MFQRTDRGYTVRFTDQIDGSITLNGEEWSFDSLVEENRADAVGRMATGAGGTTIYEFEIVRGDWGLVELGNGEVFFQVLHQLSRVAGRGIESLDVPVMGMALLAGIAHALVLFLASLSYNIEPELRTVEPPNDWITTLQSVDEHDEREPEEPPQTKQTAEAAPAAEGPAGKLGKKDREDDTEGASTKDDVAGGESVDPTKVGVIKALTGASESGPLGKVLDREGHDGRYTQLEGDQPNLKIGDGTSGLNTRGTGRGGGGDRGIDTIGGMPGGEGGAKTGAKVPQKDNQRRTPSIEREPVSIGDQFCDKHNIQETVSSQKLAIRHCYNKELQTQPDLAGKVVVQWKIGLDGRVKSASVANSTMGNREVGRCLARVIRSRMEFDKPEGGICVVKYPFVFSGSK